MKKLLRIILPMFLFLCFLLPVFALGEYVRDEHGVLTQEEVQLLNEKAARISQEQNCGIYIRVMNNKEGYEYIEDYSEYLYIKEYVSIFIAYSVIYFICFFPAIMKYVKNYDEINLMAGGNI